jgi:D-apionolactonase
VLQRVAVAVRDDAWGTAEPQIEQSEVSAAVATVVARCRLGDVDVRWHASFELEANGHLRAQVRLEPLRDFDYRRMGLVVLHPAEQAGASFRARRGGALLEGRLPVLVGPQRFERGTLQGLFAPFDALELETAGVRIELAFTGDEFEMEDQRNWTDGSFKTYSTPLSRGGPHPARRGAVLAQSLDLTLRGTPGGATAERPVSVWIGGQTGRRVPDVGVLAGEEGPRDPAVLRRFAHVRVDAGTGGEAIAEAIGAPIELALTGDTAMSNPALPLARVLAFGDGAPPPGVPIARGTDGHFADLNRNRPSLDDADLLVFPMTPQVHGFDDDTLIDALAGQAATLATAAALWPRLPVVVSPLTLRPRRGPGSEPRNDAPAGTDPRQATLFGAAWSLAALSVLSAAGVAAITMYEAAGPRGILDRAGRPHPCFHVLADVAELRGAPTLATRTSDPFVVRALAAGATILLANLTDAPVPVELEGAVPRSLRCRLLASSSVDAAVRNPDGFRRDGWTGAQRKLTLPPHAVARLIPSPPRAER